MAKFWLTTQWPPLESDPPNHLHEGVWLHEGKEDHARGMAPNDFLLIYELQGGPCLNQHADGRTRTIHRRSGRRGIVVLARITSALLDEEWPSEEFDDGRTIRWRYHAETEILDAEGFVPWQRVNEILGFKAGYTFRGFGGGSGLKEISIGEFEALRAAFLQRQTSR
jgi:hypothetical protein